MAKLPRIDVRAHWIRDALNRGDREGARELIDQALASGKAGDETVSIDEFLRTAKRGRQPFGRKHRWFEIGTDNDVWRSEGIPYAHRLVMLRDKYGLRDEPKLKMAIARYEAAMDESRQIDRENEYLFKAT